MLSFIDKYQQKIMTIIFMILVPLAVFFIAIKVTSHFNNVELKKENKALATAVADTQKNAELQHKSDEVTKDTILETNASEKVIEQKAAKRKRKVDTIIDTFKETHPELEEAALNRQLQEIHFVSLWEEYCQTVGADTTQCAKEVKQPLETTQKESHEETAP